jgi:hypothetical protein
LDGPTLCASAVFFFADQVTKDASPIEKDHAIAHDALASIVAHDVAHNSISFHVADRTANKPM